MTTSYRVDWSGLHAAADRICPHFSHHEQFVPFRDILQCVLFLDILFEYSIWYFLFDKPLDLV